MITRPERKLGDKHLIGGGNSSLTLEKVREEIVSDRQLDLSVNLRNSTAKIASNDDSGSSGQIIGFYQPEIDKGKFWDDAFPTTIPAIKTKIRVDNKPDYFNGVYDFGGELYLEKNPTGRRVFNIMVHAVHVKWGYTIFAQQLWRDIKIATDDDLPLYINQRNFTFAGTAFRQQVATTAKMIIEDIAIYIYMTLRQDSGISLTLYSANLWFKKVGALNV